MTECYTEDALDRFISLRKELDDYKTQYFDNKQQAWVKVTETTGIFVRCDKVEVEYHQAKVRQLKQDMESIAQDSLVDRYKNETLVIPELKYLFSTIAPLVYRRRNPEHVKKILGFNFNPDGELFPFSDPVKILTKYVYCGCGHVTSDANTMTEAEALLAEEHLKVCQFPLERVEEEYSVVSKHTIGRWNCKACYIEPNIQKEQGVAGPFEITKSKNSTEWCPKFLRPFRSLTPINYLAEVRGKSCYGGILHKQISISLEKNGKQYLVAESMCDTCGYGRSDKKEIITPNVSAKH